jgi:hypothetical protein
VGAALVAVAVAAALFLPGRSGARAEVEAEAAVDPEPVAA